MKGKNRIVRIYELVAEKTQAVEPESMAFCRQYEAGLEAYLNQDWEEALNVFEDLHQKRSSDDKSVELFYKRCLYYRDHPRAVPENWNGVTHIQS